MSDLAERARRVARRPANGEAGTTPAHPVAPRVKPVRVTTDLSPQQYRALVEFAADAAVTAGRPRMFHTDVLRALVAELADSSQLRAAVMIRLNG